jgi:two-component system NtrC family sensor kinase
MSADSSVSGNYSKKKLQEAMRVHLAAIIESSDDAIVSKTLDGTIVTWNKGAERMFGYTAEEIIGRSVLVLIPQDLTHEEDFILGKLRLGERIEHYETVRLRKDGRPVSVSLTVSPVKDEHGEVIGASKIARDIAPRRLAEELQVRLAAVVESSEDAIISKTLESIITTWNSGAQRVFGYAAEEAIGQPVTMLFPPDLIHEEHEIISRIHRGDRIEHYQTERVRKDGVRINVSLSVSPIKDATGRVIGVSKIARDITEQRRQQQALQNSEARLRAVVEATPECEDRRA